MDDKEIQEFIRLCAQARLANRAGAITLYINAIDGFSGFALHTKLKAIAGMQAATDEKRQDMMRRTVLADVDKWIEKQYQEIAQAALRVALDNLTEQQTPSVKPVQRSQAQDFAILNALIEAGYDPCQWPLLLIHFRPLKLTHLRSGFIDFLLQSIAFTSKHKYV